MTTYAFTFAIVAAAVGLRYVLDPWMGDSLPLVTLFGAVAAVVWLDGYRPAILAALLGYLACAYLFIEPRGELTFGALKDQIGFAAYLFTCALIIVSGETARRSQAEAHRQREVSQVTLRSIGDAVITTDVHGLVTSMNAVAETLTGWTEAEGRGQPLETVFRIVNEQTRSPVENPATKALRQGVIVGLANHTVLIRKDDGEVPIDDSAAPIRDDSGTVSGCVLIFRDVTAQRRMEQEKASQLLTARLLSSIVETSNDAIISKSLDGIIRTWNAAAERLFGYPPAKAIGRHISLLIPPERLAEEDEIIARLRAGERLEHFETERVAADGRRIAVSLTISPIKDAQNNVVGASKIVRDVTRQREVEDNLRTLAADLAEADRRKTEFLAMLAHELRNPLAPISNAAKALRVGSADPAAFHAASEMLERQVGQMARLVDDLLDMSRITRGRIELRREHVELGPIVEQAVEAIRAQCAAMSQELTVSLPKEPVYLDADPARLAQVISNLLNNACKFTDVGGRIQLTVDSEGGHATIRVRDNGIGIEPEHLTRVFDMFEQVDTSLERSRSGLGIGLTLVKSLVELHGGTVSVRSEGIGRGTEFAVRLPALAVAPRSSRTPTETAPPVAAVRRRVLVVDDSEDAAESLAMLLQFGGHETMKAHDGVEAVAVCERWRPDAVLLDIGLPRLNGYEACRRIRQQPWGRNILLIALTGWGQDEDRQKSEEAGFNAHIVKPPDYDALMRLLALLPSEQSGPQETVR